MSDVAYLDYNATAPVRPSAAAAVAEALRLGANPSSVHRPGRTARRLLEQARGRVAALVGAAPDDVVFTSGGTEANNLALAGTRDPLGTLIVSAIEHDSVLAPACAGMARVEIVRAETNGLVDLTALERALDRASGSILVSVMLANNETGVIQPVGEAVRLARARGARVHCDAVQAAGRIPVDIMRLGVDMLTLSGHKIGGPPGVGALVLRGGLELKPLLRGGGQERGRRAGTENLPGIAGFGAAALEAAADLDRITEIGRLRDDLERRLTAAAPAAVVYGAPAPRLPNTICIGLPGVAAETQVMALDLAGVAVSAGAACSSGKVRPSHVLQGMGFDEAAARSAIRISLGWASTEADADRLVQAWTELCRRVGRAARAAE